MTCSMTCFFISPGEVFRFERFFQVLKEKEGEKGDKRKKKEFKREKMKEKRGKIN